MSAFGYTFPYRPRAGHSRNTLSSGSECAKAGFLASCSRLIGGEFAVVEQSCVLAKELQLPGLVCKRPVFDYCACLARKIARTCACGAVHD